MCAQTFPTGKYALDSPRDQTEAVAGGMLVLPGMAVQTSRVLQINSISSLPDGVAVFIPSTKRRYVFVGEGENIS